ncbi:hypothetical protein ACFYWX_01475 [Streptomyces sp. NPDC002888]|uniref:hypothetical protein n=1 Tax=Streptomyces sp. NPDC002888 TaxID=3364668 RepID=UPI00367BE567
MAVDQLPGEVREFANYLDGLLARLDQGGGWCGVFWQRDPEGMQACLGGREVPPWDVMEALLQDLAMAYGPHAATQEKERARSLHAAALIAYDARPGGRDALGDRLDVMLREQKYAVERQAELGRMLAAATTQDHADAIRLDHAWARDDHDRATARCAELRSRMAELDRRTGEGQVWDTHAIRRGTAGSAGGAAAAAGAAHAAWAAGAAEARGGEGHGGYGAQDPAARDFGAQDAAVRGFGAQDPSGYGTSAAATVDTPAPVPAQAETPAPAPAPVPKQRKRRRGSARFAGAVEEDVAVASVVPPEATVPTLPAPSPATGRTPRGARFAGAAESVGLQGRQTEPVVDDTARRETAETVERLIRLREESRSGEAHALLVEIAYWPAARFPLLAAQLQHAGLGADWATLLWEAASLPADRLVAAADALAAAGRTSDGEQILRQGVARPAAEIGEAVLGLAAQGRRREVRALLDAYVRVRTPEEAARSADADPQTLVPLLVEAARGVSDERHWDLVHALRVAGHAA